MFERKWLCSKHGINSWSKLKQGPRTENDYFSSRNSQLRDCKNARSFDEALDQQLSVSITVLSFTLKVTTEHC